MWLSSQNFQQTEFSWILNPQICLAESQQIFIQTKDRKLMGNKAA